MTSQFEIGFMVGLIEGEGCIKHFRHSSQHGHYRSRYPSLSIVNTDLDLLEYAKKILDELGVSAIHKVNLPEMSNEDLLRGKASF